MSNPNQQTSKNRQTPELIKKALAATAIGAVAYPLVAPNIERIYANGKQPTPKHEFSGQAGAHKLKSGNEYHQVRFNLGAHGRIWDVAEKISEQSHQDIRDAADKIETYLPDQENHIVQPNQIVTVQENSRGEVVANPSGE